MNNKDREALNKFIEEDTLSLDDPYLVLMSDEERAAFIAERFFEAGAKHGRAELQEELLLYKEAARSEAEFVNELKEENKKLVDALKFYADRMNWSFDQIMTEDIYRANGGKLARQVLKEIGEE